MAITGYLTEFSLAEVFQLLDQGCKTGLLTICTLVDPRSTTKQTHHIWFRQGQIVGAANTLDQQGLIKIISQRGWLGDRAASRLAQSCPIGTPLGLYLKTQEVLSVEQLKLLFYTQVMRQVCALFQLSDGWFQFDGKAPLSEAEMTGLSASATEVTLAGLRALKDWSALQDKLPLPTSTLISLVSGQPKIRINQVEWQVWEFVDGTVPIKAIAQQIQLPLEKVQQIAFRLTVIGMAEEIPMIDMPAPTVTQDSDLLSPAASNPGNPEPSAISQSFLQNLVGFLKGKI